MSDTVGLLGVPLSKVPGPGTRTETSICRAYPSYALKLNRPSMYVAPVDSRPMNCSPFTFAETVPLFVVVPGGGPVGDPEVSSTFRSPQAVTTRLATIAIRRIHDIAASGSAGTFRKVLGRTFPYQHQPQHHAPVPATSSSNQHSQLRW